jgi:hypothetical protein
MVKMQLVESAAVDALFRSIAVGEELSVPVGAGNDLLRFLIKITNICRFTI